jgi:hypothetical protein
MKSVALPGLPAVCILLLLLAFLPSGVMALVTYSGNTVTLNTPVNDDVFVAGGVVDINAPIDSLMGAGGTVTVNAPVKGDVVVAGGHVVIHSTIGGKLVAAGGHVDIDSDIGTNAVIAGGTVTVHQNTVVGKDAAIWAGTVTNAGHVNGKMTVRARNFDNTGYAGSVDFQPPKQHYDISQVLEIFGILFSIGWLILGLIIIRCAPARYAAVLAEVRKSPVVKTVVGFVGLIVAIVACVILAVTIIGIPIAATGFILVVLGLILSVLFVSSVLGELIFSWIKYQGKDWLTFIVGFVVLQILFRIPVAGAIIAIIVICLGFGALLYAVYNHREAIIGKTPVQG